MIFLRAGFVSLLALLATPSPLCAGILEDRGIEDAINRSIVFREVLIDRSMVQLYVRYGLVEMRGQVADERERDLLTYFVTALPDVKQVDNRLFVDSPDRRATERWRAIRLRSLLTMQAGIDVSRTEIAFAGGRWQLVGEVHDDAARALIAQRLHEIAPQETLATALILSTAAPTKSVRVDDASIGAIVRSTLESASGLVISDPQVRSQNGMVLILGTVPTAADKARASQLAAAARGVVSVENRLELRP
ncbi:MAG: BON domain-containing protein [Opitutae bacterium]|nr:BON domain-containing protein [Opitutae bacterium]